MAKKVKAKANREATAEKVTKKKTTKAKRKKNRQGNSFTKRSDRQMKKAGYHLSRGHGIWPSG